MAIRTITDRPELLLWLSERVKRRGQQVAIPAGIIKLWDMQVEWFTTDNFTEPREGEDIALLLASLITIAATGGPSHISNGHIPYFVAQLADLQLGKLIRIDEFIETLSLFSAVKLQIKKRGDLVTVSSYGKKLAEEGIKVHVIINCRYNQ